MSATNNNLVLLEVIKFTTNKSTLTIKTIQTQTPFIKICEGINIFNFFRNFKPIFNEYPVFNTFLTQLKMYQRNTLVPNNTTTIFHNNFNFYGKISDNINNNIKQFVIELTPCTDITLLQFIIKAFGHVNKQTSFTNTYPYKITNKIIQNKNYNNIINEYQTYSTSNVKYKQNETTSTNIGPNPDNIDFSMEQIKHELANSLNLINMSTILINKSANDPEIEKYTTIINTELRNTVNTLNVTNSKDKEFIKLQEFYNYIDNYIKNIDSIYNINEDGIINIDSLPFDISNNSYIKIKLTWFKIILDNIFKNIYGHIGDTFRHRLKRFTVHYDTDMAKLCINILSKTMPTTYKNLNKCDLYKQITDKYGLMPNMTDIICTNVSNGVGLNLINILCEKLDINWHFFELSDDEYMFKLCINVYDGYDYIKNGLFSIDKPKYHNSIISDIYLNETIKGTII